LQEHVTGLRVAYDVSQRFLRYSEACCFELAKETYMLVGQFDNHIHFQTGALCITIYVPAQSCNEAEIVEHGWTQVNRKIANQTERFIDSFNIVLDVATGL
jgi:hypothetical protein